MSFSVEMSRLDVGALFQSGRFLSENVKTQLNQEVNSKVYLALSMLQILESGFVCLFSTAAKS